ncbi:hypothetical protein OHA37_06130 [Streptomyces sp. NBC_00335]|uniref:hypothetical protein n=1 Tax=unclassified Streptomyces TaxID=2593676 RepID=UPI00224CFAC5|nr:MULTISPECIES: hypothetical protein [unclassified Streptomyces]MCX5403459.1 hypothetical protein [Streptomyces sp. NBC_00086]
MTAWQYFAGAGLVAALCPLHGHVAVAGDGHGRGARVDLCVPAGSRPRPPAAPPSASTPAPVPAVRPTARVLLPGPAGPTARHPGLGPLAPAQPGPAAEPSPGPTAQARPAQAQPRAAAVEEAGVPQPAPGGAVAPHRVAAGAGAAGRFHVRPYHSAALARRGPDGMSTLMLMVVVTTPAVLAAVALRPRSRSRG